jgi:hypothetical protein
LELLVTLSEVPHIYYQTYICHEVKLTTVKRSSQAAYPPYGLASVSLTGLSCYLIYSGLFSSAAIVSQDTTLRQSIRRSVTEQSKLLDSIGTAHMEQELQSHVLTIARKNSDAMAEETGIETSMTEDDMKDYLEIVMKELHSKK